MDISRLNLDYLREKLGHHGVELQNTTIHIDESKQNKLKQYPCTECDTVCIFPSDLQRHMRKHTGEKPFACDQCDAKYSQKAHLQKHLKSHAMKDLMRSIQETASGVAPPLPPPSSLTPEKMENYISPNDFLQVSMDEGPMPVDTVIYETQQPVVSPNSRSPGKRTFACHYCDYICKQRTHLDVHIRTHTGEKPFACTICDYACARQGQLKLHMVAHSEFPPIPCPKCDLKFARETHFIKHMRVHDDEGIIGSQQQDLHKVELSSPPKEKREINENHNNYTIETSRLHAPMYKHENGKKEMVVIPREAFTDIRSIPSTSTGTDYSNGNESNDYIRAVAKQKSVGGQIHPLGQNPPSQNTALDYSNGTNNLEVTSEIHNHENGNGVDNEDEVYANGGIDLGQFLEVSMDEDTEPFRNNWWENQGGSPDPVTPVKEEVPIKGAIRLPGLSPDGKTQFACTECGYVCRQRGHLDVHMRTHTGEKPYTCNECDYACASVSQLNRHILVHSKETPPKKYVPEISTMSPIKIAKANVKGKKLLCPICNYACKTNQYFTIHMRIHTGEKPFKCTECAYACAGQQQLKRHMLIHTGEKPFACSVCDYKSARRADLTKHMVTHTQERPFSCDKCDYTCTRKETLKIHELTHLRAEEMLMDHSILA